MTELYYEAPSQEVFDEVKKAASELWFQVDTDNDKFGYASGKVARIAELENISDNVMSIVGMFDIGNQRRLAHKLSDGARQAIAARMLDGGTPASLIFF